MKRTCIALFTAALFGTTLMLSQAARAHSTASEASALSALPVASVVVGAGASLAAPVVLSTAGAVLVVKAVEASVHGTVWVLESLSDGTRVSLQVLGNGIGAASIATGTLVTVSVIGSGVVLSAAGEAIAFVPNAIGKALLYNERVSH